MSTREQRCEWYVAMAKTAFVVDKIPLVELEELVERLLHGEEYTAAYFEVTRVSAPAPGFIILPKGTEFIPVEHSQFPRPAMEERI